jgi:hypothetical protein
MQEMAEEVVKIAKGEITNASCDAHSALRTAMIVEAIQLSSHDDGRWISLDTLKN